MSLFVIKPIRCSIVLFISALLVSGCSNSSDSSSAGSQLPTEMSGTVEETGNTNDGTTGSANEIEGGTTGDTTSGPEGPEELSTTRVNFDITVPAYVSNTLQVRLIWGDKDVLASYVVDESWTITDDFPTNTENQLAVTFNDGNGAITLGSFETTFKTGANASELHTISADQFNTAKWDDDGDGQSNLAESVAGTQSETNGVPEPFQANLELVQVKTFRVSWEPTEGAEYYRVFENPDGVSGFTQVSDDLIPATNSFDRRAALFKSVNARFFVQACNAVGCVDSNELLVSGSLERAVGYFKASNTSPEDLFGIAVSLNADGNTMAIGAMFEDSAATGVNGNQDDRTAGTSGAVYVFARINGSWQQQAYLKASNTDSEDFFGVAVSLSADGNNLAVGAPNEDSASTGINGDQENNSANDSGAVYLFERNDGNWLQEAYLKASNTASGDSFGVAVSISADGDALAVGADSRFGDSGAAYVFERSNENWQQQAYLTASNPDSFDYFGLRISLSSDGDTLAVGARGERSAATGIDGDQNDDSATASGAVYVFVRDNGIWQQQAYIKASNTGSSDGFGEAVSLSSDGNTMAVGAGGEDSVATGIGGDQNDDSVTASGAVYVFLRDNKNWLQQAYIKASTSGSGDVFGAKISLSADGNTIAIGALFEESNSNGVNGNQDDSSAPLAGAAYMFEYLDGTWQQQAYIKASNTDSEDYFGGAISLSADGNTLAVGAYQEGSASTGVNGEQTNNTFLRSGAVYLY